MASTSDRENFYATGPLHLTVVDWDNEHHRRSVAASLVAGVYILERDRQEKRDSSQALAEPWWEFFHFHLMKQLVDAVDNSIFGAIFQYELNICQSDHKKAIPHYVIAFRGTLANRSSVTRDINLDLQIIHHGLHRTRRMKTGMEAVRDMVSADDASANRNIWLAGHSLGAAMAILAGKDMAASGTLIETFLFNPPYFSAPIERITDERVKDGIRVAGSVITAGLAYAISARNSQQRSRSVEAFTLLSAWVPNIYVHPADHICAEFIGYFEHRERMEKLGVGRIEKLATQHSVGSLMMTALGRGAEPVHILPSACLTVNLAPARDLKQAHALQQWWQPESEVNFRTKTHSFSSNSCSTME